jgi:hypothetical protein
MALCAGNGSGSKIRRETTQELIMESTLLI